MSERKSIDIIIADRTRTGEIFIPNIYVAHNHEVDLLAITRAHRATIYEIKCSRADFFADKKKERHGQLLNRDDRIDLKPKYFIYVISGFSVTEDEIPEYAGLIDVSSGWMNQIKAPPCLWNIELPPEQRDFLYRKAIHRSMLWRKPPFS